MHTKLACFVVAGCHHTTSVTCATHCQRFAAQSGVVPHLYRGVKAVAVTVDYFAHYQCSSVAVCWHRRIIPQHEYTSAVWRTYSHTATAARQGFCRYSNAG